MKKEEAILIALALLAAAPARAVDGTGDDSGPRGGSGSGLTGQPTGEGVYDDSTDTGVPVERKRKKRERNDREAPGRAPYPSVSAIPEKGIQRP